MDNASVGARESLSSDMLQDAAFTRSDPYVAVGPSLDAMEVLLRSCGFEKCRASLES